ncbi:aconitate hydratase AcnA [Arenibacter algicola]|uniref:Aconitate hydratase n=1 Tax=Arenibacter algicola TaxID=616991 RepID=A0A221UYQ8_9FLAO|nr:aconitate hydratase AcnA [Arenibacter algicola]ASO06495.1 aconitate hydratase A [Arenibacter algicola]|tara:strand:- start:6229 stop:9009 length:2781 start_codon:yes stop_codon:yes gene_type:complete
MGSYENTFKSTLKVEDKKLDIISLEKVAEVYPKLRKLPFSIRILLENALRNYDGFLVTDEHIENLINWNPKGSDASIPYKPARVLMQDFTGVPAVVDIAAIRSEAIRKGKDGAKINPKVPVDLVIDHSVQVDFFGTDYAYKKNVEFEYKRNSERYELLKWAQNAFKDFTVVPPGMGICHQVNLEYLAKGVVSRDGWAYPDTLVGTDSHTPMVNGIGVVGWGVGGIEAEAALLGQPIYFSSPRVIGLELNGKLPEGITATDMVLEITNRLRKYGVVGDFVEVFGAGLDNLSVPDRATIANMSPEFGCTITYFPIDDQTLRYMEKTNRDQKQIDLVERYCKNNLLWRTGKENMEYSDVIRVDLSKLQPSVAGPKRPQDKILVKDLKDQFGNLLKEMHGRDYVPLEERETWYAEGGSGTRFNKRFRDKEVADDVEVEVQKDTALHSVRISKGNQEYALSDGSIVVAAITSCTNTSNPSVMLGAGLVAKKAIEKGLDVKPWVKTSLAPGSKVVTNYLRRAGLLQHLEALKFHVVGYGCTTCIGNSGPLPPHIEKAIDECDLVAASVLSGNRNFEARIHPKIRMNFLASPMLVVAYAIAGRVDVNLLEEPLTQDVNGQDVYLKDIWPSQEEIQEAIESATTKEDYSKEYSVIFDGEEQWKNLPAPTGMDYEWKEDSTYIKEIPFFKNISETPDQLRDIASARVLIKLGDSVTTDHISPAGSFSEESPAGQYLKSKGIERTMFNSYGSRRGNHEVMMRGTFANVFIKNEIASKQGGFTTYFPENWEMSVYDAAMKYMESDTPLIVLAGSEYGSGSSRDWAAKGASLLGVKAVIASSYERIHRSNLVGMGILPLKFKEGEDANSLGLSGHETISITGIATGLKPGKELDVTARKEDGTEITFKVIIRLDSEIEIEYVKHGGILQYVLRQFLEE